MFSFKLGSFLFKGSFVPVEANLSVFLGFIFLFFVFYQNYSLLVSLVAVFLIYVSLFLHEAGHFIEAVNQGVKEFRKLSIHFLGATLFFEEDLKDPRIEGSVALAGPLVSVILSFFFYLLYLATGLFLFNIVSLANFLIGVLNLVPVYPLDGGRVFRAVLLFFFDAERTDIFLKTFTFTVSVFLVGISIYYSFKGKYLEFVKYYFLGFFLFTFVGKDLFPILFRRISR